MRRESSWDGNGAIWNPAAGHYYDYVRRCRDRTESQSQDLARKIAEAEIKTFINSHSVVDKCKRFDNIHIDHLEYFDSNYLCLAASANN
jgi:hypothetical protein